MTTHCYGKKFLNPSIKASALAPYMYVIDPVRRIMQTKITALK